MGFDPTKVLKTVSEEARKHMNDHTKRKINAGKAKTDDVVNIIEAISNTGNTVADIYNKIITSNNATQEIKNKAEKSKRDFELQLKEIEEKYKKENNEIDKAHEEGMEKIKNEHEQKMKKLDQEHEVKIKSLQILDSALKEQLSMLRGMLKINPNSQEIQGYIASVNSGLLALGNINKAQIEMR